ncbi:peptidase S8 and S53 domain-containing protein [Dictyostelium discoideum AX4]|uniref:Peptidase S8 and S53 domain-containing protein n=1 Tax=Dictyostelium discoideum TaxID=44689 RepID=Q54RM4_DICDI|nr:peptidase S8 and S53 domain-containing protein [Dictyostelium discoideum AX4]EAL65960.1 peptidase S8 and S53 domain-containing protein [Dictyostelium discoideum AX4]|eukprot:XP_639327.1 peptidase S8 and S53 domain-containing protein [Dictyostelium discoideum AX4]
MKVILIYFIVIYLINISFSLKPYQQQQQLHNFNIIENNNNNNRNEKVIIAHPKIPPYWLIENEISNPNDLISFKILLKQNNLNKLNYLFEEISDPKSKIYGEFLSINEINELVKSSESDFNVVLEYLKSFNIGNIENGSEIKVFSDYILVETTIEKVSSMFNSKFSNYKNKNNGNTRNRLNGPAYLPKQLLNSIDFVTGLSEFFENNFKIENYLNNNNKNNGDSDSDSGSGSGSGSSNSYNGGLDDILITPKVLKSYYNVPNELIGKFENNSIGVIAFNDYFSMGALELFDEKFNITTTKDNLKIIGNDCLGKGCDQYESDLDIQYIRSMGENISTDFISFNDAQWILDYLHSVLLMEKPPLVQSISYGWAELLQCDVSNGCSTFGYDSKQYVDRTNSEFQKLALLGISVLVSSGDDGAPSMGGSSGNCPIDGTVYCPTGGCNHTKTMCPEFTIYNLNGGSDSGGSSDSYCFFPMGIASSGCTNILGDPSVLDSGMKIFSEKNKQCNLAIEYDRTNLPHVYSECECKDLVNVTFRNYHFTQYQFNENNGALFVAEYPSSSPFVTSVGATQFLSRDEKITTEVGCTILQGAKITTGGGFSSFQSQPKYQQYAISQFFNTSFNSLPPSFSYCPTNRGVPDISMVGHNYKIYSSDGNNKDFNQCPCKSLPVDGTSCSSPTLAGLIGLINDQLLLNGKTQLGFLNPLLYQMAIDEPRIFNDITGDSSNRCSRSYCCLYGWSTSSNTWDPVTGLGSIDFNLFLSYVLKLKGI